VTERALRKTGLTVQVSTKLNRSHLVTGREALILPTLGRSERDLSPAGTAQMVTVEDSMSCVHGSHGRLDPASEDLMSEVAIVCALAGRTLGDCGPEIPWADFAADYDLIRDRIERVIPGFDEFNRRVREPGGFVLPHPPRDTRTFATANGRAHFTVNRLEVLRVPPGRLLLQTMRSHDQYNTTIYGLNDRYRGIKGGRRVVMVHPDDIAELGLAAGDTVDLVSEWQDDPESVSAGASLSESVSERVAERFRVVAYPTARGCAAAYYPETNPLVPLGSVAEKSNTPASKSVVIRLRPHRNETGRGSGRPAQEGSQDGGRAPAGMSPG
jgi:anaerobic selenocysteine-containing dehydrogenase